MFQVRRFSLGRDKSKCNESLFVLKELYGFWQSWKVEKFLKNHGNLYTRVTTRRVTFQQHLIQHCIHNDRIHLIPILEHPIALGCMRVGRVPPSRTIEAPRDRLSAKLFPNAYDRMPVTAGTPAVIHIASRASRIDKYSKYARMCRIWRFPS